MIKAQYPAHLQCLYLSFHKLILPSLDGNSDGLASWKTLLTHDGFPIEPSLNFTQSGFTVRFTVDPRDSFARLLGLIQSACQQEARKRTADGAHYG